MKKSYKKYTPAPAFTPEELTEWRESKGFSQVDMADWLKIPSGTWIGWETRKRQPDSVSTRYLRLAQFLDAVAPEFLK